MNDLPERCPHCNARLVQPVGPTKSKILVVGSAPGDEELAELEPFVGWTGRNFRKELVRVELNYFEFRVTNLWLHKPNKDEKCQEYGLNHVLYEAMDKEIVLLCGAETVQTFTGYKVSEVNGLWVESSLLSCPKILAMYNPAQLTHGGLGEVRFALTNFAKEVEKLS